MPKVEEIEAAIESLSEEKCESPKLSIVSPEKIRVKVLMK